MVAFTPYVAAASLIAVAVAGFLRQWWAFAASVMVSAMLLGFVAPRTFAGDQVAAPEGGTRLTLMSANLHYGDADPEAVVGLVRDEGVDVLSLQELTREAVGRLRRAGLDRILPHAVRPSAPGANGGGLYARAPLEGIGDFGSPEGFRQPGARMLGSIAAELVSVHPVPPTSGENVSRWRDSLRALPPAGDKAATSFLLGDFNATLDHEELRDVLGSGYVDAADVAGEGLTPTWQSGSWVPLTIDHLLVDERAHVASYSVHDLPGSDHQVVLADVIVPEGAGPGGSTRP